MGRRELGNATVVITGGAGGLGVALGVAFRRAGSRVALLDVAEDRLAEVPSDDRTLTIGCDVTDPESCAQAIATVEQAFGDPDVLVNSAGLTQRSAFVDTDLAVYRRIMEVNYFGSVTITKAALPGLIRRRGAIVVISSVAGFAPLIGRTGYSGSKHALHGTFGTLRSELPDVDVTLVCPTFIDTSFRYRTLDGDGSITDHPQSRVGRMLSPEDAATATVRAVERRRRMVVLGATGKVTRVLAAVAPALYERVMRRSLRSELQRDASL